MKIVILLVSFLTLFGATVFSQAKKNVSEVIEPIITKDGLAAGISEYKKLKSTKPKDYNFDENQLETLGNKAMAAEMDSAAMLLFKLNTESFPKSSNAHYKLGYAYLKNGRNDQAQASLQKAIALNPKNAEAKAKLNDIKDAKVAFVCPPCYCSKHNIDFKMPGKCPHCKMTLVKKPAVATAGK
jgi:tetratricopeptide (TPR) repeat protein